METNSQNDCHAQVTTRREFLVASSLAAAGAVAVSSGVDATSAEEAGRGINLISPTFETSPTYLATYPASDRAKQIVKDGIFIDALFSAVYPATVHTLVRFFHEN